MRPAPGIQWSAQNAARTPRTQPRFGVRYDVVDAVFAEALQSHARKTAHRILMQRRGIEFVLNALEMIEPLDRTVEFGAFLFTEFGFHASNLFGESGPIEVLYRGGDIGQHREALVGHFRKTAEHDDLLLRAT
jgi:hypothetical protein